MDHLNKKLTGLTSLGGLTTAVGLTPAQNGWLETTIEQIQVTDWAAEIYDREWNLLWISDELKLFLGEDDEETLGYGEHIIDVYQRPVWKQMADESQRKNTLRQNLPYITYDTPGRRETIRQKISPQYIPLLEEIEVRPAPAVWATELLLTIQPGLSPTRINCINLRIHDANEEAVGTARIYGPGLRASVLNLVAQGDEELFERMSRLVAPGKRPVAVLFADVESSVRLSRKLPSAAYFRLISSLTKAIDEVIIRHNGVIGKHVGDGVSAFFVATDHGATSSAARAAIVAAREIRTATASVCEQIGNETGLTEEMHCKINLGLHWGATVYMGQIVTGGRLEVTALGDEINECARIQETASGGQILASKPLIERLSEADAKDLGIEIGSRTYEILNELEPASAKTTRDGLVIPVTIL